MRPRPLLRTWLATALVLLLAPAIARAARVETFAPLGVAKQVRQVSARFSEPMVPLGDPRASADPFAIECPAKGASRWADPATWVFTFESDLPAGLRCAFTLREGLRSLAGASLGAPHRFEFSTGGPAVLEVFPSWGNIAEDQRFALKLDAPATAESVERNVVARVTGLLEPVGVRIVTGPDRDAVLATFDWDPADARHLVLEARQRFAPEAGVTLVWGAGVATESGIAGDREQTFDFSVRPAFHARIGCERENEKAACVPIRPIRIAFSSPVNWSAASRIVLQAEGAGAPSWSAQRTDTGDGDEWIDAVVFRGPFPPRTKLVAALPAELRDDAGRTLSITSLETATDRLPPLAKFSAPFGVIESAAPALPVALRHVADASLRGETVARAANLSAATPAEILRWLHALIRHDDTVSLFASLPGAKPQQLALPAPAGGEDAEVVGIPLDGPGLHVVEIESRLLGTALLDPPAPMFVTAAALVTNLAVHFKWAREASLVWVTTLDRATPVAGAAIEIVDCSGAVLAEAQTDANGIARIASLPSEHDAKSCNSSEYGWSDYGQGLLVLARVGDDLGLAHSSWSEGIETWRFGLPEEWNPQDATVHTVFDRTLLRAGDTLHMKHVLRRPVLSGFAAVPPPLQPDHAVIRHVGSDDKWTLPVNFDASGSALSEWAIPKQAKLGEYAVDLVRANGDAVGGESGAFRVEAFRVPLMRGVVQPPRGPLVQSTSFPLDLAVSYLSGGAASSQPVTLRTQVRERSVAFPDYDGFSFANGGVREGVTRRSFGDTSFGWERDWEWGEDGSLGTTWRRPDGDAGRGPVATQELKLDAAGTTRATVGGLPRADRPLEVQAELAFRDPSGETQTSAATIPLWPSSRVVGLRTSGFAARDSIRLQGAVLDVSGAPLRLAGVSVDAFERKTYVARKRMVGGFYAYDQVEEVRALGRFCSARTDRFGRFSCEGAPPARGSVVLVARSDDWWLRESAAHVEVWTPGDGDDWFAQGEGDRIELIPEQRRYEPGETARFQVRMPFRAATALVAVEREGVSETFVTQLSGDDPVVEVPVTGAHAPNVFVSVLAVRGRQDSPAPTGSVDLAKPSFRLGIAEIQVGWKARELEVRVEPEKPVYRVRETAAVRIAVRTPDGAAPPAGAEVAIAAVDEGLLELMPNTSWKLLDAMMGRRSYGVHNATASLQVVGKRHFGRKAVPSGGGGGQRPTRELFDTLLLWNGRVALDAAGDARVEIPLNDSLTGFRIEAIATAGEDRFGSGHASIRTTQELMILEGLPKLVRDGDRFAADFTLRNTTEQAQQVQLHASVEGLAQSPAPMDVALAAGEAREVHWDVDVPPGTDVLRWQVDVSAQSGISDRMRFEQRVEAAVPVRVWQSTLLQVDRIREVPVEHPADALPGRGGLDVALRPRLADGRDGIERAMRAYPYTCLEQRASVAVALRDDARWNDVMAALPAHLDGDGLARFFPSPSTNGSVVLTAYVLSLADAAGREVPSGPRERMLGALTRFVEGSLERDEVIRSADLPLRKLAAAEALARHGRATPALIGAIAIDPRLLPNGALLDWIEIVERVPGLPERDAKLAEANSLLRARLDVQGSTLGFATSRGGAIDWLLATTDANAARLVLSRLREPAWQADMPRLVRHLLSLQRAGAWPTTMANAWGSLALDGFSKRFEAAPVTGTTSASVGVAQSRIEWAGAPGGGAFTLPWPPARADLALRHEGSGAPWAIVQSRAAVPLREPFSSGYRIERHVEPVSQRTPGVWSRGDVARVSIVVEAEAESAWVVLRDPLPAGVTVLGRGLGGETLLAGGARDAGSAWEAFTEAREDAWQRYYEWVPKGSFRAEYTVRFNQSGRFGTPPTRVEALYAPERMGETPNLPLEVAP